MSRTALRHPWNPKAGETVTILHNAAALETPENTEGRAKLLRCLKRGESDGMDRLDYWRVEFTEGPLAGQTTRRWVYALEGQ